MSNETEQILLQEMRDMRKEVMKMREDIAVLKTKTFFGGVIVSMIVAFITSMFSGYFHR